MSKADGPDDEAFRSLDARLNALSARNVRKPIQFESGSSSAAYRLIGELVGGVLAGLGLGWLFDRLVGTAPLGLIFGVLLGAGGAVFLVARSAGRLSDATVKKDGPARSVPFDDDETGDAR